VRDEDLTGLFDLVVAPERRGRGHGRALVDGLLRWAATGGARRAYLQVLATNVVAVRLYERAGFREAYRYWYRLPP
jgi:N-acetylglutamate synthase